MINIDDYKTLCPGCFKDKGDTTQCLHCKFDESKGRSALFLPYRTILHGQYIVGRELGKPSGFGITYLALDSKRETCVAIMEYLPKNIAGRGSDTKIIAPHTNDDIEDYQNGLNGFLKEALRLAKLLDHPNILNVKTFFEENGTGYLVRDYYPGRDLSEFLKEKGGRVSEAVAMDIMMPVLDGLKSVHRDGFIHRDINPYNIYITNDGRGILTDFSNTLYVTENIRTMSVVVRDGYSPFEQYSNEHKRGSWTDVYACGATLYIMVTGETPPIAIDRKQKDMLVAPHELNPEITPKFSNAILNAMAVEPKKRPKDVDAFIGML